MPKVSVIIPCYNERKTIEEILKRVKAVHIPGVEKEIVVVDDGSRDGTREILETIPGIRYIFHEKNLGKGGAVKTGFTQATGDIFLIQDADLEYDPQDYPKVLQPILNAATEMVLGVRVWPTTGVHQSLSHRLGNGAITWVTNVLYSNRAAEYTGCYKAFTKKLVDSITVRSNDFAYEHELVAKALKRGYKSVDVPIRYYPRDYHEGKKINWKDGVKIVWAVIKYRFVD